MVIYDYWCEPCGLEFEISESIKDHEFPSLKPCPACAKPSPQILSCKIHHIGTKVKDAYKCPALGQIIKSDRHRDEIAKQKGLIEIGNEKPETIHKHFDNGREDKRRKSWDEV